MGNNSIDNKKDDLKERYSQMQKEYSNMIGTICEQRKTIHDLETQNEAYFKIIKTICITLEYLMHTR